MFRSIFQGPKTIVAEYYGPFTIDANGTKLFAYSYEYSDDFAEDYYIKYSLYKGEEKIKTAEGDLNLVSGH